MRKCAVWLDKENIEIQHIEMPPLKDRELKLKVQSCAICGSDLRIFKHGHDRVPVGQIVGHEISGIVSEIGTSVTDFKVGDSLSVGADVPCGECDLCKKGLGNCCEINYAIGHQFEGGFTEEMLLNELTLTHGPVQKISDGISFDEAALAEPLACCINGYEVGLMSSGKDVVIFGAGPIGMMLANLAPVYQANKVILVDPNQSRLEKAKELGIVNTVINPTNKDPVDEVMKLTAGQGVGMIFTACPDVVTHSQGIKMLAKRGVLNLFGGLPKGTPSIELESNFIHYQEAFITGSHGSTPEQHKKALSLIENVEVDVKSLISCSYNLDDIHEAYEKAASGEAIKVIVKPNGI